jgi:redox-sensitive bicupin YhaK (pirin superfamily)
MHRKVKYLLPAAEIDMGGFPVKQALPTQQVQQLDPFLLLHHAQVKYTDRKLAKHQGVGPHPHRGFAPVTFVIEGEVHHRDSRGNSQVARAGEVQWMYTGAGIIHSERPSQSLVEGSKRQEIIQLWINSPASKKMIPPEYYHLSKESMPSFKSIDGLVENKLVAGSYAGQKSTLKPQSDLLIITSTGEEGGEISFDIPSGFNTMLYVVKGQVSIKGYGTVGRIRRGGRKH